MHNHVVESINSAFIFGIILNGLFVVLEFLVGFFVGSIGLISDAGHNLSDIISLILAMLAIGLSKLRPNTRYTYGYKKTTVLASLINALLLMMVIIFIFYESVVKIVNPVKVEGEIISITAAIGVAIKGISTFLFHRDKERDLNIKGVYLHMLADTLVGLGVVVSGLIMKFTQWYFIDGIVGLLISIVILVSTWSLLAKSFRLTLDGVPHGINTEKIISVIEKTKGVQNLHHLHLWAISTRENALTAHIVADDLNNMEQIKKEIKNQLSTEGITHITLEFETEGVACKDKSIIAQD